MLTEPARLAGLTVADAFDDDDDADDCDCNVNADDNYRVVAEWVAGCDRAGTGKAARASILAWVAKHRAGAGTTAADTANDCDKEITKWATASGDIGRDMLLAWVAEHGDGGG